MLVVEVQPGNRILSEGWGRGKTSEIQLSGRVPNGSTAAG